MLPAVASLVIAAPVLLELNIDYCVTQSPFYTRCRVFEGNGNAVTFPGRIVRIQPVSGFLLLFVGSPHICSQTSADIPFLVPSRGD